jgi:hypothetical protein
MKQLPYNFQVSEKPPKEEGVAKTPIDLRNDEDKRITAEKARSHKALSNLEFQRELKAINDEDLW